jgi:hypothetical protein
MPCRELRSEDRRLSSSRGPAWIPDVGVEQADSRLRGSRMTGLDNFVGAKRRATRFFTSRWTPEGARRRSRRFKGMRSRRARACAPPRSRGQPRAEASSVVLYLGSRQVTSFVVPRESSPRTWCNSSASSAAQANRESPKSRMNRAIPHSSSSIVVTVEPGCHAGGRTRRLAAGTGVRSHGWKARHRN